MRREPHQRCGSQRVPAERFDGSLEGVALFPEPQPLVCAGLADDAHSSHVATVDELREGVDGLRSLRGHNQRLPAIVDHLAIQDGRRDQVDLERTGLHRVAQAEVRRLETDRAFAIRLGTPDELHELDQRPPPVEQGEAVISIDPDVCWVLHASSSGHRVARQTIFVNKNSDALDETCPGHTPGRSGGLESNGCRLVVGRELPIGQDVAAAAEVPVGVAAELIRRRDRNDLSPGLGVVVGARKQLDDVVARGVDAHSQDEEPDHRDDRRRQLVSRVVDAQLLPGQRLDHERRILDLEAVTEKIPGLRGEHAFGTLDPQSGLGRVPHEDVEIRR